RKDDEAALGSGFEIGRAVGDTAFQQFTDFPGFKKSPPADAAATFETDVAAVETGHEPRGKRRRSNHRKPGFVIIEVARGDEQVQVTLAVAVFVLEVVAYAPADGVQLMLHFGKDERGRNRCGLGEEKLLLEQHKKPIRRGNAV